MKIVKIYPNNNYGTLQKAFWKSHTDWL